MAVCYTVPPDVHVRRLDDEVAGDLGDRFETHLLDDAGGQVLEAVRACDSAGVPASLNALLRCLGTDQERIAAAAPGEPAGGLQPDDAALLLPLLTALVQVGVLDTRTC